jgi:hypothetical protein
MATSEARLENNWYKLKEELFGFLEIEREP